MTLVLNSGSFFIVRHAVRIENKYPYEWNTYQFITEVHYAQLLRTVSLPMLKYVHGVCTHTCMQAASYPPLAGNIAQPQENEKIPSKCQYEGHTWKEKNDIYMK